MKSWILFGLLLLCMLALSAPVYAQGFGRIVGTVTDANGAVVANAKVTATEVGKGLSRTANADSSGYYVLESLRPAQYDMSVEATGFHHAEGPTCEIDSCRFGNGVLSRYPIATVRTIDLTFGAFERPPLAAQVPAVGELPGRTAAALRDGSRASMVVVAKRCGRGAPPSLCSVWP